MRKIRIITGLLALAVAGCAPARSAQGPKPMRLVEVIDAQLNARGALRWAKDRPLVPGDFRGAPPTTGGQEGAHTEYTIISGARCTGRTLEFHVTAAVLPTQSWMATELRRSPGEVSRTLRHEQTHFDISEVFARRIRRKFAEMYDPCSFSEEALQEFSDKLVRDEAKEQSRYDSETNHGRTVDTQADWDRQVAAWLDSLSKYGQ